MASRSKLALLAGCSRAKIDRILTGAGLDLVPRFLDDQVEAGILASYRAGASLAATSRAWGVSTSTVALIARRAGALRAPGRRPGYRMIGTLDPVTVLELHTEGGIDAIVAAAHCSVTSAYRLLRHARRWVETADYDEEIPNDNPVTVR